jgi:hydroxymethylbilane synthase
MRENVGMNTPPLSCTIATRESRLALWQAEHVQALLRERFGWTVELLGMTTRGDQILDRALSKVGGKGLFVKELELALEEGRAHLAVHSLKDVPMALPEGFTLCTVLEREDPRDAWVSSRHESVQALPIGARVGTSSLRRLVQLKAVRPDLDVQPLRGNLDTRLRKLDEGQYDGIVLAAAGLKRLGLASRIRSVIEPAVMLPAAGQGALGIEVRTDNVALREALATLIDTPTWLAVHAERAVSRALGGSCSMPLAAQATWRGATMVLEARLGHPTDAAQPLLRAQVEAAITDVAAAEALGLSVAGLLRAGGGLAYLAAAEALSAA